MSTELTARDIERHTDDLVCEEYVEHGVQDERIETGRRLEMVGRFARTFGR